MGNAGTSVALKPGDRVEKDECERVGNFPHGILKNPDALKLDPGALGSIVPLASRKQDYIDAFEARDLTICNEATFAKINTPYIVHLERSDDEEPPVSEAHGHWLYEVVFTGQTFSEGEICRAALCGRCLYKALLGTQFFWSSDIGSMTFDLKMHQYMNDVSGDPVQCPQTGAGGCACFCSPAASGTVTITSFWDPETMNPSYLQQEGINGWYVIVGEITISVQGGPGAGEKTQLLRAAGTGPLGSGVGVSWTCFDEGDPFTTTIQSAQGSLNFFPYVSERWIHNRKRTETPELIPPPPGTSWPDMIDDPLHDTY
jgi:hypothetical protein